MMPAIDHSGGIHFMPNDGRRFPLCGSWRSNWNQTSDPERATCPQCRALLASQPPARVDEKP